MFYKHHAQIHINSQRLIFYIFSCDKKLDSAVLLRWVRLWSWICGALLQEEPPQLGRGRVMVGHEAGGTSPWGVYHSLGVGLTEDPRCWYWWCLRCPSDAEEWGVATYHGVRYFGGIFGHILHPSDPCGDLRLSGTMTRGSAMIRTITGGVWTVRWALIIAARWFQSSLLEVKPSEYGLPSGHLTQRITVVSKGI